MSKTDPNWLVEKDLKRDCEPSLQNRDAQRKEAKRKNLEASAKEKKKESEPLWMENQLKGYLRGKNQWYGEVDWDNNEEYQSLLCFIRDVVKAMK